MRIALAAAMTVAVVRVAGAHQGPRVWLDQSGGKVVTLTSDNDISPTVFTPSQVFAGSLAPLFGVFTTEFPGYEVRPIGSAVAGGTIFGFRLAGPLLTYDAGTDRLRPTSEVLPAPAPQMALSFDATARFTGPGPADGFDFFQHFGPGDHSHLAFTLLGDGTSPSAPAPDATYVVPLISTSGSLASSSWYFIVFDKNAITPQRERSAALAGAMAQALPGDANFDGTVNIADFSVVAANFNTTGKWWADGDFDFDASVGIGDFSALAANFNRTAARPSSSVPEAFSGAATLAPVAACLRRRRRCRSTR
jgi:hypothetical protein